MSEKVVLKYDSLEEIRKINPSMVSYNIEMTEVTGGTFWRAYTEGQIEGTEAVPAPDFENGGLASMHQPFPPTDTTNPRMIKLARELGKCWVRVSGTWATRTYYDFDGIGYAPEGYQNRLTKEQWINLVNFVKAVDGKLLVSFANCEGLHSADEPWNPSEAEKLFNLSLECGVPISAVEFTNEPNMLEHTGFPKGYTAMHYRRDQDLFHKWVRDNYPDCIIVGPSSTDGSVLRDYERRERGEPEREEGNAGIADVLPTCTTRELLDGCSEPLDIFSYHYYGGISERMAAVMPEHYTPPTGALSEEYLGMPGVMAKAYAPYRDKYTSSDELWVTESGDAGAGGHAWATTYLEVPRALNEFGIFAKNTNGVIFHNTLAASDYGYLERGTFLPRPQYFAVLLWNTLMGTTVYESGEPIREGAHVYAHSRKDGKDGVAYLVINNSWTETTTVTIPKTAEVYALSGNGKMRSRTMLLGTTELALTESGELPKFTPETVPAGDLTLAPGSCTFIVM